MHLAQWALGGASTNLPGPGGMGGGGLWALAPVTDPGGAGAGGDGVAPVLIPGAYMRLKPQRLTYGPAVNCKKQYQVLYNFPS